MTTAPPDRRQGEQDKKLRNNRQQEESNEHIKYGTISTTSTIPHSFPPKKIARKDSNFSNNTAPAASFSTEAVTVFSFDEMKTFVFQPFYQPELPVDELIKSYSIRKPESKNGCTLLHRARKQRQSESGSDLRRYQRIGKRFLYPEKFINSMMKWEILYPSKRERGKKLHELQTALSFTRMNCP
jgi:hypothetical protein